MKDVTGQKFGRLTAIKFSHMSKNSMAYWMFQCDCGNSKTIELQSVLKKDSQSCGCLAKERTRQRSIKHGYFGSPTYITWDSMHQRCKTAKPNTTYYRVIICEKWKSFEKFLEDMGERPKWKTLDRIDSSKGYFKENCRWATRSEQSRNTRKTKKPTSSKYKGVVFLKNQNKWSARIKANYKTFSLGSYKTEEEAALAYNKAVKIYHGEFAILNSITPSIQQTNTQDTNKNT